LIKCQIQGYIYIELGKFDLSNPKDHWLMYFTEPNAFDRCLTQEERDRYNEVYEAMEELKTKNFTPEQLLGYELYIDGVRQYVTTMDLVRQEGIQEGLDKGKEEGLQEGLSTSLQIIEALKKQEETPEDIALRFNTNIEIVLRLQSLI
jgi:predicted transposase YdaD